MGTLPGSWRGTAAAAVGPRPGFGTLLHIVLEQQVSLASARAAFDRLAAAADPLTPARFLAFSDAELLAIGFSRQKARYGRALAVALEARTLDLDGLAALDDAAVARELEAIPASGRGRRRSTC